LRTRNKNKSRWWTGDIRSRDVGKRLRIVPYWERSFVDASRINIIIDPGPSFGAGDHPSTLMALELLEDALEEVRMEECSPSVLDAGTGTGVLAIAAMALGARFAVGFDIDAAAVFSAKRNVVLNAGSGAETNPHRQVDLFVGTAESLRGEFHIVLANLAAPTLIRISEILSGFCGTFLILSGIADAMKEDVLQTYQSLEFGAVRRLNRGGWNALVLKRGGCR
jgi:ribosomal protein L11 methyltransferase